MQKYCNRVRVATYLTQETFKLMEEKRKATQETQSRIIAGILDAFFEGGYDANIQN